MSQRSSILSLNSQTNRSQCAKNPLTECFKQIMRESGIILSSGSDEPNILTQEQSLVVRDIENLLKKTTSDADCIDKFVRGFKILIKKKVYLNKALLPTQFKKGGYSDDILESSVKIQQESLFRILLKVDQIQYEIIEILLDQITNNVSEEMEDSTQWLRLFLTQLRYLPHIKNVENLTTKLLDIMDIAPFPAQLEILDSIPEILPDSEYNETAKQLAKMLDKSDELTGAIIDCLNALNLDSGIRMQVQDHILSTILMGTSTKIFPILLEFLIADYKTQNLLTIFTKIRSVLDTIMASSNKEKETEKILIFQRLQALATTPKTVSDAWLALISNIKQATDHKPIDLLILLMLHSSTKLKKRMMEAIFRKRIKDGLFKCSLLEQLFAKYLPQQLLRDYFTTICEIGMSLFRTSNDAIVIEFASTLFKLLYNCEHTEVIYRQEILDKLILLVGASDQKNVTAILNIVLKLLEDITRIQHHTIILMRLLEKLDTIDLKDVKLVFEILSTLTCSDESLSGFKEEIHMIIRKQLSNSKRNIKCKGIIAAIIMAKHIGFTAEDQSDTSIDEETITLSTLRGSAKEAASILELANTSTSGCPDLVGFYYDQIASMLLTSENLDKYFLAWLYETITADFQTVFVTESICEPINDLEFDRQFNVNTKAEMDVPLAVNIAELTLVPSIHPIAILAPHFRLLRLLHYRQQNGDLSTIDALLGCSVILPKLDNLVNLENDQLKQVADCLFHCINWFREAISGFVTQKNKRLRHKVVQRVNNVMELEQLLRECLNLISDEHKLPISYFDVTQTNTSKIPQAGKPPKKKVKTSNETIDDTAAGPSIQASKKGSLSENILQTIKFRDMDTDIIKLLKYPLIDNSDEATQSGEHTTITLQQFNFILKDFVSKLNLVTQGQNLGLSHLNMIEPLNLMTDCTHILANIHKHFMVITKQIQDLLDEVDGLNDAPEFFTHDAQALKHSFGTILECLSVIFSWSGFQHTKNLDLLRNLLKAFRQPQDSQVLNSVNHLSGDLVDKLGGYVNHCLHLNHAVSLVKIMEALHSLVPNQEIRIKIAKTSGQLLNKQWFNFNGKPDSGKNQCGVLISSYLSSAKIKTICGLVATLQDQVPQLKLKTDSLQMLASVNKSNFYIFYRNLWNCLHDRVKSEVRSLTTNEHLTLWKTTALTMQGLMMIVKIQETKTNLVCFLKKSIAVLRIFLSHGIPILEIRLKSQPSEVVAIFKTIQANTRFLHYLCCQSKLTKDVSLMNYVPQFRLTLETLVYRVKAALVANDCSDAFWIGNLRNRDMHGEDILSQSTTRDESEIEDDEEIIEDDEELSDVEIDDCLKSGSEVFD